jgi:hypothetical protein
MKAKLQVVNTTESINRHYYISLPLMMLSTSEQRRNLALIENILKICEVYGQTQRSRTYEKTNDSTVLRQWTTVQAELPVTEAVNC